MLSSLKEFYSITRFSLCLILANALLVSCVPENKAPRTNRSSAAGDPTTEFPSGFSEPSFPYQGIFIHEGITQTVGNLTLPGNFGDSFLIRGLALSKYLKSVPSTTKFCLATRFNLSNQSSFLLLTAKPRSFTNLVAKTVESYLQVEPANRSANVNDCVGYNLESSLYAGVTNPTSVFSLSEVCPSCSSTITSLGMKVYFINGEELPGMNFSSLTMTIAGKDTGSGNFCAESSVCQTRGFDCCLEAQCVRDRAVRPGIDQTDPNFLSAKEDVRLNPDRFIVYPQYYFVCSTNPPSNGGGGRPTVDPQYEAALRKRELGHLYECLNQVKEEFSYCTLKFEGASANVPGSFSGIRSLTDPTQNFYDDINFSTSNPNLGSSTSAENIVRIVYGGETIFDRPNNLALSGVTLGTSAVEGPNDVLNLVQSVFVDRPLGINAKDDILYVTYKVDGTCTRAGSSLLKCVKTFIRNFNDPLSTKWHGSSPVYQLPTYADLSFNVIVKVNGTTVPEDTNTWTKSVAGKNVTFTGYQVFDNQTVEITYFASDMRAAAMRTQAQNMVNQMCECGALSCNLRPLRNENNEIVNYECVYPSPTSGDPPVNQTVFVSGKNIPHRYFDSEGVPYDEDYSTALPQESSAGGRSFSYTNGNFLLPNNLTQYVGFNEIFGSFEKTGTQISRPAKLVKVKKDTFYDILVNSGVFSSCQSCGSDYYSALQRIFPQNFAGSGGGYAPDLFTSSRLNNSGPYRSDDLLFGRACFVPATMLPWTHVLGSSVKDQRRARLAAQHFLFANGYQRDWFGFDYGSLIGSFDGVKWFSVGNMRRIKSTTNKLFLAVNAAYGDLNVENNFSVTVSETSVNSSPISETDFTSDGAECQRAHLCTNDNDCIRQLGYEYSCQNVATLTTPWPNFDQGANEIVGSSTRTLASLIGGTSGQPKRCVYRGRGAPCSSNLAVTEQDAFNGSTAPGNLACSSNNFCGATSLSRFNDRISRFATSPANQNILHEPTYSSDTVGLGARIIGRPFNFYGRTTTPLSARTNLTANKVHSVCTPGKEISSSLNTAELNSRVPASNTQNADKLYGVGVTLSGQNSKSLLACPATDSTGALVQLSGMDFTPEKLKLLQASTISQNLSSGLLDLNYLPLADQRIFSSTNFGDKVSAVGYQRNTCLRAPGAACFSDLECAPSNFVAGRVKAVSLEGVLNPAEEAYWGEELVCGNPDFKYLSGNFLNPNFDLKKNKCCRETAKTITVETQLEDDGSGQLKPLWCDVNTNEIRVAGVNVPVTSGSRYSRVHSGYDKMTCKYEEIFPNTEKTFALSLATPTSVTGLLAKADRRFLQIQNQFKTLDAINTRTCCTANWVRSFHTDNGGGHAFGKSKVQNIDKSIFRHINWREQTSTISGLAADGPFYCTQENYTTSNCEIKELSEAEQKSYLDWVASLELLGIPQVGVKTEKEVYKLVDDNQDALPPQTMALDQTIETGMPPDFRDGSVEFYSAASFDKFKLEAGALKKVFSENEFNCCVPSGQIVPQSVGNSQCCTGFVANNNNQRRCCLPDFTNVSVYLNRYVSSEGKGLPDSAYDPVTGYIKDIGQVRQLALSKNLCCSGNVAIGVAVSNLSIPIGPDEDIPAVGQFSSTMRFIYLDNEVDNNGPTGARGSLFDAGLRWNNQIYCVPAGFTP